MDGPAVRGARHRVRVPELNLLDETLEGRRQRAIQGSLSCIRTKPSKQQVSVSAVVFWQEAGSDELQLLVAAREPSMPAGLLVAQGLTIRPATAEPVASIPTPSTIGVNILQVRRDEVEVVEVRRQVVRGAQRVEGTYGFKLGTPEGHPQYVALLHRIHGRVGDLLPRVHMRVHARTGGPSTVGLG